MITFRTPPANTDFTTLADVKEARQITDTVDDAFLTKLIERASDEIVQFTRRPFARAAVTDDVVSFGGRRLQLFYPPVVAIEAVRLRDTALTDISDIVIIDAGAGIVGREKVFESTQAHRANLTVQPINYQDLPDWSFDYTGGFLMPGDNIVGDTNISAASADNSFNTTGKFPLLVAGDIFKVSGFAAAANNGSLVVTSRTPSKIIVASTLVTEAAGPAITMTVETLPKSLQHAAIEIVTSLFDARSRSRDIKSERLGDHATTYGGDASGVIPSTTARALSRWVSMI